jgi:hypothetical protein
MNIKEFEDLVDLYGEDLSRWPQALRAPAMGLLERSEDARKVVDRAKRLRALFSAAPRIHAPTGLADRIVARAAASVDRSDMDETPPRSTPWYDRIERPLRSTLLFSCLAVGLAMGLMAPSTTDQSQSFDTLTMFADFVR